MESIKNYFVLFIVLFSLYSCSEDRISDISSGLMITSFSLKSPDKDDIYALDIASDGTITNKDEIPLDVDFSRLIATFESNSPSAKVMVGDMIQESGVTENDFSSTVVYRICDDKGNSRDFTVKLRKSIVLLSISFSDENLKDKTLIIDENGSITNESFFSPDDDLTSLVFDYETSFSDYLLYTKDGTVIESGKTKIDCSAPVELVLKSSDGRFKVYELNIKSYSQILSIENIDDHSHSYYGGGTSFALYLDDIFTLSADNKEKFFKLMFEDVKLKYIQYYTEGRPRNKRERYDRVFSYINEAKRYNPNLELVLVIGAFPEDLCVEYVNDLGYTELGLDTSRGDIIYEQVAEFLLELMNDVYENYGCKVSYFSMSNEPDTGKQYRWGNIKDNRRALGKMLNIVLPKFKEILSDKTKNKFNLHPKIIAPSTMNVEGCSDFIGLWQKQYKIGYGLIDIVSTHQYGPKYGCNIPAFEDLKKMIGEKGFFQTEMHTNRGDDWGDDFLADNKPVRGILSLSYLFSSSVVGGVEAWFYFLTHNHKDIDGGSAALIQVKPGGTPTPFKHYYAFKQLHNLLSIDKTYVLKHKNSDNDLKVVCMGVPDENKVVAHVGNIKDIDCPIEFRINKSIKKVKVWKTDENSNMELVVDRELTSPSESISLILDRYSLTSVEVYY